MFVLSWHTCIMKDQRFHYMVQYNYNYNFIYLVIDKISKYVVLFDTGHIPITENYHHNFNWECKYLNLKYWWTSEALKFWPSYNICASNRAFKVMTCLNLGTTLVLRFGDRRQEYGPWGQVWLNPNVALKRDTVPELWDLGPCNSKAHLLIPFFDICLILEI